MPSTKILLDSLQKDFPELQFTATDRFSWQPADTTITYDSDDPEFAARLLHELGHAQLTHTDYTRDIDLIAMERDAWQLARTTFGPKYAISINADTIEEAIDTYRDWLHARSTCPNCQSTGLQTRQRQYTCLACRQTWRVNEARSCALRRYR